ncbi:hypothetical protein M2140_001764 [Clostridiales Family XIII bacterium PM5-7]
MLFKKEIRVTRNLGECNEIRNLLSKNGIKTSVTTNTITNPGRHHGVPFIDSSAAYQCCIFVDKRDEEKALSIVQKL